MKSRRRTTDFATYRRLLGYLRGDGRIVCAVFLCIALESVFTVVTISSLKPVLNLLGDEPILERPVSGRGRALDATPAVSLADGRAAFRAVGDASGDKAAARILSRARAAAPLIQPPATSLVVDLSPVGALELPAWAALFTAAEELRAAGRDLTVILPADAVAPPLLDGSPRAGLRLERAGTPPAGRLLASLPPQLLQNAPAARSGAVSGPVDNLKLGLYERVGPVVDRLQHFAQSSAEAKFRVLISIVGIMLLSAALMVAAGFAVGYLSSRLAVRVLQRLRNHLFRHMMDLDLAYFTANSTGAQMSVVIQDVQAVEGAVDILFSNVLKTPVTVVVLVAAMYLISPRLTLFTFTVLPLMGILIYALGRRVRRTSARIQQAKGALASYLEEAFSGMRVVKAYNMEEREARRFEGENSRLFRLSMKTTAASEVGTSVTQLLSVVTIGLMVLAGGYIVVVKQELSYSDFLVFVTLLTQVFRPLKGVPKINAKLQRGLAGCDRVFAMLDRHPSVDTRPDAVEAQPLRDAIELRDVTFQYAPDRAPVLDAISLRIAAGRSIALVGHAGCGKSTLANLIPRFYDPTAGSVVWDGTDLRDLNLTSLRRNVALITQDVILFDDTVANNIAYGAMEDVPREKIEAAARAARAHDFIMRMPDGYDTMVGGRGMRLSGGERQRLAIARAILKDAPVLVLDEATSALDSETEALVQEALTDLMAGRTSIVIAHRLSTIQNCDEIYVMEQGRFVEHGAHDELLARDGRYARFYNIQFGRPSSAPALNVND